MDPVSLVQKLRCHKLHVYANGDDLDTATYHINQIKWTGEFRYLCRSPCRMKTTAYFRDTCTWSFWDTGIFWETRASLLNWQFELSAPGTRETGIPPRFVTLPFAMNASFLSNPIVAIYSNSYIYDVIQMWRMPVAYSRRNSSSKLLTGRRVRQLAMP